MLLRKSAKCDVSLREGVETPRDDGPGDGDTSIKGVGPGDAERLVDGGSTAELDEPLQVEEISPGKGSHFSHSNATLGL